jgi:hypothetical protein
MLSDAAVITFGADKDVTLTHVADTGLLLNGTSVIQFNDASQNIGAPSNAILDINATDEIELNATLLDVNANINASGTYTGAGTMTTGGNIVIPNAGNIGSVGDTDSIAIASNGVVTFSQIPVMPANSIDSDEYIDGSIDRAHLAADIIDATKIADDAIDSEHYTDGSIDTAHIADNQITLAKMDGIARGKIIYGDASGDPAVLTAGSNGQVLSSDGTDISWAAAATGAWIHVSTTAVASGTVTDITVTDMEVGYDYRINLSGIVPATNNTTMYLRTSTDNGSSYDSGSNYEYYYHSATSSGTHGFSGALGTAFYVIGALGATLDDTVNVELELANPRAAQATSLKFQTISNFSIATYGTGHAIQYWGGGKNIVVADIDAVQFYMSSGNFTASTGSIIIEKRALA